MGIGDSLKSVPRSFLIGFNRSQITEHRTLLLGSILTIYFQSSMDRCISHGFDARALTLDPSPRAGSPASLSPARGEGRERGHELLQRAIVKPFVRDIGGTRAACH